MTRIDLDQKSIAIERRSDATVKHLVEHGDGIPRAAGGGEGLHGGGVAKDVRVAVGLLHALEETEHRIPVVGLGECEHEAVVIVHIEAAGAEMGG